MISEGEFLTLSTEEVAGLVRKAGPQVCVFPINGTRRWAAMEYGNKLRESPNPFKSYMDCAAVEYIRLYDLLFSHGVDTIISPLFGTELFSRGEEYINATLGHDGIERMFQSEQFLDFYNGKDVRVRVYGDFRRCLSGTPYAPLVNLFDNIVFQTSDHKSYRLFFGLFANDVTQIMINHTLQYVAEHPNQPPEDRDLIKILYGEQVDPATIFIGFDRPTIFDYPLLSNGEEDLYFTYAPSPYLNQETIRMILYDHIYLRHLVEPTWERMSEKKLSILKEFYDTHRKEVLGVGNLIMCGDNKVWIPETPYGRK